MTLTYADCCLNNNKGDGSGATSVAMAAQRFCIDFFIRCYCLKLWGKLQQVMF